VASFALNIRILRLHRYFSLVHVLCEVEVNIFSSIRLKLDLLRSSDVESFLLGVAIAEHGNACPSLGMKAFVTSGDSGFLYAIRSAVHKYNKSFPVRFSKNVTYSTADEHSGKKKRNKQTEKNVTLH